MANIKEKISQLKEKIEKVNNLSQGDFNLINLMTDINHLALDIIKKQEEVISALIEVNHGLAKVKSLQEE